MATDLPARDPILLCLDLESGSEALVRRALEEAERAGTVLHVLSIVPKFRGGTSHEDACARLAKIVSGAVAHVGPRLEPEVRVEVSSARIEEAILACIEEVHPSMVVLGRRKRKTKDQMFVPSTTRALLAVADVPVLTVPIVPNGATGGD